MLTRRFVTVHVRRPRDLVDLTMELEAEHVNIESFRLESHRATLLTDHPDKTLEVVRTLGLDARLDEVLQFDLPNERGALARITTELDEAGVQVLDGMGLGAADATGPVYLNVDDLATAEHVLERVLGGRLERIMR